MNANHPSVLRYNAQHSHRDQNRISNEDLTRIAMECGADDVGLVAINRPELEGDRDYILSAMPSAKSIMCIVKRMAEAPVRAPARSLSNHEFHSASDEAGEIGRAIVTRLTSIGVEALNTSIGFPMEMQQFPGRTWIVSHKLVAEAAGLGKMGIHRNLIHPKFGNFILLNSIILDCEIETQSSPIDYNPCLECKLCVAVCPVGAIGSDGHFDAVACLNHNYREFMGGFIDWVDTLTESKNKHEYRAKVSDQETASMWQSLSTGPNYKSAYCMAVCPAGDNIIGRFLEDRPKFLQEVVKPLQQKIEPVYVVSGSDAEAHAMKRFPNKIVRRISSGVRPNSIKQLIVAMPLAFQRGQAKGIETTINFKFTGNETESVSVTIRDQKIVIEPGELVNPRLHINVDSESWLKFLAGRISIPRLIISRKLKFRGDLRQLALFGRCFPS